MPLAVADARIVTTARDVTTVGRDTCAGCHDSPIRKGFACSSRCERSAPGTKLRRMKVNGHDIIRIAAAAGIDPSAVRRYLRGDSVRRSTVTLVTRAASDLGITLPAVTTPEGKRAA